MSDRIEIYHCQQDGMRLDKFLVASLPEFSRSRLQGLVSDGFVRVNQQQVTKNSLMLFHGDEVQIHLPPPQPSTLEPEEIPLDIIFENDDLILINKPAGMVVHPSAGHESGTLVHAALAYAPEMEGIGGEQRPGVVHRLDKDTSGLILLAKNDRAHKWLQDQFRLRKIKKVYLALVDGKPPTPSGKIEAAIGRDPSHRKQMAVVSEVKGRAAVTEYLTRQVFRAHTLLEAHPLTGRTHQIRLHLAMIGCPITGDTLYGRKTPTVPLKRHFLHAFRLTLILPGESVPVTFEAPLPSELKDILEWLKKNE
ncbi:MAG TPA: RluA family pseudouridine synthase [Anaerolineaceae bacterium]